ncbi:hypothetical protein [uncultured Fusobacterium sp.]|uniref:hypothetical protein n=1 Tax=uncultured Fusobacterium sp. TaxID=159267 RepID=UPI0025F2EC8B|nr:hypothetical protein [uncultured Fusobacterium sp.]
MANLFEGASKLKNEAEEIDKVLENLKLTSARLEKIEKTFSEIEKISPDLEKINREIKAIKREYESIDGQAISNAIKDLMDKIYSSWKLWLLYIPLGSFLIAVMMVAYIYLTSVRSLKEQNGVLVNRLDSIYKMHLLDKKYWYNKENQELFLKDYEWIKKEIAEEKKKNKS